jgi:predicted MPP superfamily phosphohydrolase
MEALLLLGPLFLFAAACLGHLVLVVPSHNWWYGLPLSKKVGDVAHLAHGFWFAGGVIGLYLLAGGLDLTTLFAASSDVSWRPVVASYVVLCWAAAGLLLPAVTTYRLLRAQPAAVADCRTELFDTVKHLGYAAVGEGSDRFLAALPGNEILQVEIEEATLRLPRLPTALDGLTVLHLSDLHLRAVPERAFFRAVMDRCAALEPDLVAITGDIADSIHHQKWIVPVLGRLRWRVAALAILGNHDYWYDPPFIRRRLTRLGIQYLGCSWKQLDVRGQPLVVIGNEEPWGGRSPDLSGCPEDAFRLCLSHTPDNIAWARRSGVDLMLTGHVHGGQVRLPLIGSILVPSRYGRRYDGGWFQEGPTLMHVSRGLSGEHPLRYGCKPEISLLTLRKAEG